MIVSKKPPLGELAHYGVLGMKWGHHKRVESVNMQNARKKVKDTKQQLKKEQTRMNRETGYGMPSDATLKRVSDAGREHRYAKDDLSSVKILEHLEKKGKSKAQLSMEEKYKQKGMSDDEAAVAAYRNIRTKKILLALGTTALVVGGAYTAYKYRDARIDKILKSGTLLQNVTADSTSGIRDAFYSASNPLDKIKYKGLYGETLASNNGQAFKKDIKLLSDIKQASYKNAHATLSELMKTDSEFSDDLKKYIAGDKWRLGIGYLKKTELAEESLKRGILDKNVYEVFNASLVDHSPEMQKLTDKYFNALTKKGYNAIKDVNDSKYSGYKSINPIIAFNSKGLVDVIDVKELTAKEIDKAKNIAYAHIIGSDLVKQGSVISAAILGVKGISSVNRRKNEEAMVKNYRNEHPGSKLTSKEIVRMIERSR